MLPMEESNEDQQPAIEELIDVLGLTGIEAVLQLSVKVAALAGTGPRLLQPSFWFIALVQQPAGWKAWRSRSPRTV
ncbi:MAG: hypothetical protein JRI22_12330 [Deltaproteobacteria bacterium]|nr:hypothetical protein [Deltaproteobacteria bacterium]